MNEQVQSRTNDIVEVEQRMATFPIIEEVAPVLDSAQNVYGIYVNKFSKRKLIYEQAPRLVELITLIPGILFIVLLLMSLIYKSGTYFIGSMLCCCLMLAADYFLIHRVLRIKHKAKGSFWNIKGTYHIMFEFRIALLKRELDASGIDKPDELDELAHIFEMRAEAKSGSKIFVLSVLGIIFLPVWSEFISWTYSGVDHTIRSNGIDTMFNLIPGAMSIAFFVCMVAFWLRYYFLTPEKNELMKLASIIKRISLENGIKQE